MHSAIDCLHEAALALEVRVRDGQTVLARLRGAVNTLAWALSIDNNGGGLGSDTTRR